MEFIDLILALNAANYSEIIRFYNQSKTIKHISEAGQKRTFCRKIVEYFGESENINNFLRNNFTSESENYFESLILSNPLNGLIRIEGEENLKKIDPFRKCGFIFNIKKDYFAVADEIFQIFFKFFNTRSGFQRNENLEIKEYLTSLPDFEYSFKMSRVYLDPYFHFIKYLYLAVARDISQTREAADLFENAVKDMRGRFPMLDTIRKFIDSAELLSEIKRSSIVAGLYSKLDRYSETDWLAVCVERFIKETVAGGKDDMLEGFVKKLKPDLYYNLKSCQRPAGEVDSAVKFLLCLGVCEVIYSNLQPVYLKLSPFGEKVYNILFPTLENIAADMNAKKKIVRRSAVLTPDFKLICENLDIGQYIKILCFSNLLSFDNIFTFDITRETVIRSIRLGMNFNDFKALVQKIIKGAPPENVMKTVLDWYLSVVVMAETPCVLISVSAASEKLSEIEKDQHFTACVIMKVKPAHYLALPEKIEAVRKYFSDRSIPVVII
ncbi:MAG TPA: hypothetical protein PK467_01840 [Candidatus Wallbacteria bacterium]|nr:hypothetical protein [Candidatus Wallbacteria bacterium]